MIVSINTVTSYQYKKFLVVLTKGNITTGRSTTDRLRRRRSADEETDFITAVVEHVYIVDYSTYSSNLIPQTGMYNNKAINTVIYVTFLSLIVSKKYFITLIKNT